MPKTNTLPTYTLLNDEADSPEAMVAALRAVATPVRPTPKPRIVEKYFRYVSTETAYIVTLTQMQERFARSQERSPDVKRPYLLDWAAQANIGDRYTGHLTVICISKATAMKEGV
jgi:hypothetical protein